MIPSRQQSATRQMTDMMIAATVRLSSSYGLLRLSPADGSPLLEAEPGQFVQVLVPDSPTTFLRRPISICNIDAERGELWLLVRDAGEGTRHLINLPAGSVLNIIYPLGHGFDIPEGCRGGSAFISGTCFASARCGAHFLGGSSQPRRPVASRRACSHWRGSHLHR